MLNDRQLATTRIARANCMLSVSVANADDVSEIMRALDACRSKLLECGIDQWDDFYPSLEIFSASIKRKSLYLARKNTMIAAVVGLDKEEPSEYSTVNWLGKGPSLVVHHLFVHPQFWRQGLAASLMEFAESKAIDWNCHSIRLDAYEENHAALALYTNRGYVRAGEVIFPRRKKLFVCFEKHIDGGQN